MGVRRLGGAGIRRNVRGGAAPISFADVPGMLGYYTPESVEAAQWTDTSPHARHLTTVLGTPSYNVGVSVAFAAAGIGNDTDSIGDLFDNKELLWIADWAGPNFMAGSEGGAASRLNLRAPFSSAYKTYGNLLAAATSGVLAFAHDGTNFFAREDGVELDSTAIALTGGLHTTLGPRLGTTDGGTATCTVMRFAIFDASSWGVNFTAYMELIEAEFGV